ncbi:MAG: ABC transporter permease [Firmicutes bacterium]|nr:ABC transporter permease [Bacillota bacterium]
MLFKNAIIKVKKSYGRFISLLIIIAVGVGFFAGIRASSPDITSSMDSYYDQFNLMDLKVLSPTGFTDSDISIIKKLNNTDLIVPSYSIDLLNEGNPIKIHALEDNINQPALVEGRLPISSNECLADSKLYNIGDTIPLTGDTNNILKNHNYKVVGTINSVLYIFKDYGISNIGNGKLHSFIFIDKENFQIPYYTEIYLTAKNTKTAKVYTEEYDNYTKPLISDLVNISKNSETTKWYIFDRTDLPGYVALNEDTQKVSLIAAILPVFFMVIVALMSLNTMTRMIEEERGEMGTLTSLGYSNSKILSMYLLYVFIASIAGILIGFFGGSSLIPYIIHSVYKANYILPPLILKFNLLTLLLITFFTLLLMFTVTIRAGRKELKQRPAALLRPVPLKRGKTILLEKIGFIWRRLSFTWKVTMRNIFRYKKRVFMTIVGIAGCTALLLTGFGIRDSVDGIADIQYKKIFKYDNSLVLKNETNSINENLNITLQEQEIKNPLLINQITFTTKATTKEVDLNMIVPENVQKFEDYFILNSKLTNKHITLDTNSIIITQKLSELTGVSKGDTLKITSNDNKVYKLKITDVAENYVMHYIYMNNTTYKEIFGENTKYNIVISNNSTGNDIKNETKLAENLMSSNLFTNVNFTTDNLNTFNGLVGGLNNIIIMIIGIAAILALLVLVNLTSINISERKREIATLKVLGFYDNEVNKYIYRETFLLTFLSILIGLVLGIFLHRLIIDIIEVDSTVFLKQINILSYLWAFLITVALSVIVQIATYFKLKKINMIDSLKSVD